MRAITDDLVAELVPLKFGAPVSHVYNPLVYARETWNIYCDRYGTAPREVLLVGLNPGPFGMTQVGVPFGEVGFVRDWLRIEGRIGRPDVEHPKRPVLGFDCHRSEVSGARFWGWAKSRFQTPERFFGQFFVANYCPLVFMDAGGANVTPDKVRGPSKAALFAACDRALKRTVTYFEPKFVLGIGKFAEARARAVVGPRPGVTLGCVPHPSPASPAANRGWAEMMDQALVGVGVALPVAAGGAEVGESSTNRTS